MDVREEMRVPVGRVVGNTVLAVIVGALLPLVGFLQVSLLVPVVMLGGVLAVRLRVRTGWVPTIALAAVAVASTAWFMGVSLALVLLAASLLPALVVARGALQKQPFFEQMRYGIFAFVTGLLAAMLIAYASFGSGMVGRFVDLLRAEYDRMPDAALMPLVEWANSMLSASGVAGIGVMTVERFRGQLSGILDLMEQTYAQALPGTLLSGALLSGVISVLWGNWTMARQGMATNESFIGMSRWFLPPQISLGAVGLWVIGRVVAVSGYEHGATLSFTISQVAGAIFAIQALAALDRRMVRSGGPLSRRRVLIVLLAVLGLIVRLCGVFLAFIGVASALFGSRGAVRSILQGHEDDDSDHDDPEE